MARVLSIFRFSWLYIRDYKWRLYGAILAGIVFGISNAGVLGLTRIILQRLAPETQIENVKPNLQTNFTAWVPKKITKFLQSIKESMRRNFEKVLDNTFPKMGTPLTFWQGLGAVLGLPFLVAIRGGGQYLSAYWMSWVGERMVNDLRVEVLDRLSRLSLNYFNKAKMGDMMTRINGDTLMLQHCISHGVKHSITDPVTIIAVFLFLMMMDWQLTLCVIVFLPICLIPILIYGKKARRASKNKVQTNVTQSSLIIEMLSAIRVVKAYSLEEREVKRFGRLSRDLFKHTMKGIRASEIVGPIIETASMMAVGGLILFVVQTGRSIPDLVTFFLGIVMFYMPVKKLAKLHVLFEQTSIGVERLQSVLNEKPEVSECTNAKCVKTFSKEIEFQNVSFAYDHRLVIRDLNMRIAKGKRIGIAGESGSGKSTFVNLLFRFIDPSSGRIRVDGIDLKTLQLKPYRHLLALVSQDIVVFDQSVFENIASGKIGANQESVFRAAKQAHAMEFIKSLDKAFETRLGERGTRLSGGQKQRIAIARAFVRDAPILVLDEATAALDARSESEVQSAIDALAEKRTVICIAHRLSTLKSMDEIFVLDKGSISENGDYESLLKKGGSFAQMAARQGIITPIPPK